MKITLKKTLVALTSLLCAFALVVVCVGCSSSDPTTEELEEDVEEDVEEIVEDLLDDAETEIQEGTVGDVKSDGVMTYAEYDAADIDSEVVIETYIQATQSWWDGTITCYTQDYDGAYFIYNMECSEEDAANLVAGTKIKVTGYKSEWSGEVEIADATFEFVDDGNTYVAEPIDVTELLSSDELIDYQNARVSFTGLEVVAADDSGAAFLYSWDGSGSHDEGSDLYFNVSDGTNTYTFTVESYLCDNTTDVYAAVEGLNVGDVVNMEGFLYWYEGVNPHITSVTVQ